MAAGSIARSHAERTTRSSHLTDRFRSGTCRSLSKKVGMPADPSTWYSATVLNP